MANTYSDFTGLNTRKTLPTSRLGTRNIVWYQFSIDYDLLRGEAPDNYTAYTSSNSLYHRVVEIIQEAAELYHLGAPTQFSYYAFVFGIVDNDEAEVDPVPFNVGFGNNPFAGSVAQALYQFFGNGIGWSLTQCYDEGFGIISA